MGGPEAGGADAGHPHGGRGGIGIALLQAVPGERHPAEQVGRPLALRSPQAENLLDDHATLRRRHFDARCEVPGVDDLAQQRLVADPAGGCEGRFADGSARSCSGPATSSIVSQPRALA